MNLTQGVHYRKLSNDLSVEKTREVLAVLDRPEILAVTERWPIEAIVIDRTGEKAIIGEYHSIHRVISVNSARKPGIHLGEEFRAGETGNMSAATWDKTESMRRSVLQELAHHIENCVPGMIAIVSRAYANPRKRPITRYARRPEEYFAETFIAFLVETEALSSYDPVGSTMVQDAFDLMRMQK